jgi:hypothetical protein
VGYGGRRGKSEEEFEGTVTKEMKTCTKKN